MVLNDTKIPGYGLTVSVATEFSSESLSGETSSTSSVHKGIKPKIITVSFIIKYIEADSLTSFYRLAESVNDNGELTVYNITSSSANAANIRQVIFSGRIDQREMQDIKAWRISFSLQEYLSTAEKTELRQESTKSSPLQQFQAGTQFEKLLNTVVEQTA
ncbi:baseplate complex protein [Microbulbifer sp. SSSA005]|uniref:baseplate complex protein n=1 Tax=Microbulbifer sp. SSSA005 TaxID=3243378 RepID=UPI004039BEEC